MKTTKRFRISKIAAVCAAVILILGLGTAAYASDLGGVQRSIQLWIHGDQTDAVLDIQDGSYTLTYEDEDGSVHEIGGGGVAYDLFGRERPLTEEEILEHLDSPEVRYEDDGTVWVYYHSQKIEITDKFDQDGFCYVLLADGGETLYMTVQYDGGFATSPRRYPSPKAFQ